MKWWRKRKFKAPIWVWIGLGSILVIGVTIGLFGRTLDRWGGSLIIRWFDDDKVRFTISEETTRIVTPLRSDGYVDYVAALDRRASEGVTPENNASVLFWQAMGPRNIAGAMRVEYFDRMGIEPLPPDGEYLTTLKEFALQTGPEEQRGEATVAAAIQSETIYKRPWTRQEFPLAAEWLAANEKPLGLLLEASRRERRYDPLMALDDGTAAEVLLPCLPEYKRAARELSARAMLRIGEHEFDGAIADLLACHRLARLVGQGDLFLDALLAATIEQIACHGDRVFLQASATAASAEVLQRGLDSLGPMPNVADKVDIGERYMFLDVASATSRDGLGAMSRLAEDGIKKHDGTVASYAKVVMKSQVNWDTVLTQGNDRYDRRVSALRSPLRAERQQILRELDVEQEDRRAKLKSRARFGANKSNGTATTEHVSLVLGALLTTSCATFRDCEDGAKAQFDLIRIACALARYRADHGSYPPSLIDLTPGYMADVPEDAFANAPLRYSSRPDGYVLYSVGVNGRDDQGKSYDDALNREGWDDLVVRMKPAEPEPW